MKDEKLPYIPVKKSNNLIQSIGKTDRLAKKVLLMSLLKIEKRIGVPSSEQEYYKKLEGITKVDYTHGMIAEFSNAELKSYMKTTSGSYYNKIKQLMDVDDKNSLQRQCRLYIKDDESGLYGSTDIITATIYDANTGRMYVKFSGEEKIQQEIYNLKNNYTVQDFALMMVFKNDHAYNLYELLTSRIASEDVQLSKQNPQYRKKDEYVYTYNLSELKYLLGVLDPYKNAEVKKAIESPNPDWEAIEELSGEKIMVRYNDMEKNIFKKVKLEIDSLTDWIFSYEPVRNGRGGKVAGVTFRMTRNKKEKPLTNTLTEDEKLDFIDEISEMIGTPLKSKELKAIAEASGYKMDKVKKAVTVLKSRPEVNDTVAFLISAIKKGYEPPVKTINENAKPNNQFNNYEQRQDYDMDELEKRILSNV